MFSEMTREYPHINFKRSWELTPKISMLLGQCEIYIKAISSTPILPDVRKKLLQISMIKGAQATTAIEGNTLTEQDVRKIQEGMHLPPSREYQEIEVKNVLEMFNKLLNEVVYHNKQNSITPELMRKFQQGIGKNLGNAFDAIPGKFRTDDRVVGTYRCPDHRDVEELICLFCDWIAKEFYRQKTTQFYLVVLKAIITHVYLEWIHPFGDGNGRTGRLLEFYILLCGGFPDIASHILSNHYNNTRSEYYRQLNNASESCDLTEFIQYALTGLRDGLHETFDRIQGDVLSMTWEGLIYKKFASISYGSTKVFKRRRRLMLSFPLDHAVSLLQVPLINTRIARDYATLSKATVLRDINALVKTGLLIPKGEINYYAANTGLVLERLASKVENTTDR